MRITRKRCTYFIKCMYAALKYKYTFAYLAVEGVLLPNSDSWIPDLVAICILAVTHGSCAADWSIIPIGVTVENLANHPCLLVGNHVTGTWSWENKSDEIIGVGFAVVVFLFITRRYNSYQRYQRAKLLFIGSPVLGPSLNKRLAISGVESRCIFYIYNVSDSNALFRKFSSSSKCGKCSLLLW